MSERSLEMLTAAFANLGATPEQAPVMAAQLLKRARQVAEERGSSETEALAELLAKVVAGRSGEYGSDQNPDKDAGDRESG